MEVFWLRALLNLNIVLVYLSGIFNPLLYILLTENFRIFFGKIYGQNQAHLSGTLHVSDKMKDREKSNTLTTKM